MITYFSLDPTWKQLFYWVARQANLCFHFAGSGENLPDIAKSRDAGMDFAPHPDEAEQLPVLSHKLPFFSWGLPTNCTKASRDLISCNNCGKLTVSQSVRYRWINVNPWGGTRYKIITIWNLHPREQFKIQQVARLIIRGIILKLFIINSIAFKTSVIEVAEVHLKTTFLTSCRGHLVLYAWLLLSLWLSMTTERTINQILQTGRTATHDAP